MEMKTSSDETTRQLLKRWLSLEDDQGWARVTAAQWRLNAAWWVLFLLVVGSLAGGLSPVIAVIASAMLGWVVAERNALRVRQRQWPIFRKYLDWERVRADAVEKPPKLP